MKMLKPPRLVFGLSDELSQLCNVQFCDAHLSRDNVDTPSMLTSHSAQLSWQFHRLEIGGFIVVMAVESFSRYTLFLPFMQTPNWQQVQDTFIEAYSAEVYRCFERGGFMRWHQRSILQRNFQHIQDPVLVESMDAEIQQLALFAQQGLQALDSQKLAHGELAEKLCALSAQLNQKPHHRAGNQRADVFFPLERFLSDSLYRFAGGLCDLEIPGCKAGEFPNPYRANPDLNVVCG